MTNKAYDIHVQSMKSHLPYMYEHQLHDISSDDKSEQDFKITTSKDNEMLF